MKKFAEELKVRIAKFNEVRCPEDVILHFLGEEPETKTDEDFIRNTNIKYFGVDTAASLLGNFAEVRTEASNSKMNFIRFNLDAMFDTYSTKGWMPVMAEVRENLKYSKSIEASASEVIDQLPDYNAIKSKLIIRPLNFDNAKNDLTGFVFKVSGDIALVLYAVVLDDEENGALNTVKIPLEIANSWDIDIDTAFIAAMVNTMQFAPARIYTNILKIDETEDSESDLMNPKYTMKHLGEHAIPLVTTTRKTNGAISLFYPGVKEKIAEMFDDSFYVAFTSIHEAMIHKNGSIDASSIKRHVMATNRTFGPQDTLSNEVYYFNKETKEFMVCEL